MALNETHDRTDVMNDPNYLLTVASGRGPAAKAAEARLQWLQHSQMLNEQMAQRAETAKQAQEGRSFASEANREQRAQVHEDTLTTIREAAAQRAAGQSENSATRRAAALQLIAADPNNSPAEKAAVHARMLAEAGVQVNPAAVAATSAKGEYGPGGAPKAAPVTTAPLSATTYVPPTDAFASNYSVPSDAERPRDLAIQGWQYPILPNTSEQRFVDPAVGGPLAGSTEVPGGIRTPSGGFIGGNFNTPSRQAEIHPGGLNAPVAQTNPSTNEASIPNPIQNPTDAFTSTTASGGPQPNPTPGVPPAKPLINQAADAFNAAPIVTPTPATTPPAIPVANPQASNDRTDLLRDTDNIFYGGGNAPAPSPTPTPIHPVVHQMLDALAQRSQPPPTPAPQPQKFQDYYS